MIPKERSGAVWLTAGIAAILLAAACSATDDSEAAAAGAGGGSQPNPDGGTAGSSTGGSSFTGGSGGASVDGSPDGLAGSAGVAGQAGAESGFQAEPTSFVIHASSELFDFRVCLQADGAFVTDYPLPYDSDHHLPETNYPGIPKGGVINFDDGLAALDGATTFTAYLVKAKNEDVRDARPTSPDPIQCADLFEPGGWDELPAGEFVSIVDVSVDEITANTVRALVVEGPGTGRVWGFSPTIDLEPTTTYLFPAYISDALGDLQAAGQSLELSYGDLSGEPAPDTVSANLPTVPDSAPTATMDVPDDIGGFGAMGFNLIATDGTNQQVMFKASLANVQRVTSPYSQPDEFFSSADGFALIALGDPDAPDSWLLAPGSWNDAYDGAGMHMVALPFYFVF